MDSSRAVLFADIAGSTGLYEKSGDTVAMAAVVSCVDTLKTVTLSRNGRVVKTIGDELMAVFDAAADALRAANDMQVRFTEIAGGGVGIRLRIGFHFGPVIESDGDCFGDTVNLAARLTSLAAPDQILTSRETWEALPGYLQASCRKLYSTTVKGRKGKVTIIEALWKQDQGQTLLSDNSAVADAPCDEALITYMGREWVISEATPEATIGRDAKNTVTVDVVTASRHHASVMLRERKIVLADHSSNGTFVRLQNGQDLLLRREELVLAGRALIGLGAALTASARDPLVITVGR